jgi:hypothetical protein
MLGPVSFDFNQKPIQAIWTGAYEEDGWVVGNHGVTRIQAHEAPGQLNSFPLFSIWAGGELADVVNGSFILFVTYVRKSKESKT